MKKYLLSILIFIMFIPLYVNAETCDSSNIKIESIKLNTTTGNAKEVTEASINDKKINLDLKMYDPGDSIEYILKVKNTSKENYYFDEESLKINTDYLQYEFIYDDNSSVVEANSEKIIKLKIEYKNKVPTNLLVNDSFNDINTMRVNLSNKDTINVPDTLKNPETGDLSVRYLFVVLLSDAILLIVFKKKKATKYMILIIGLATVIPISVNALCKYDIEVEAKIQIDGKEAYFLIGPEVNIKMKQLAGDDTSTVANGYSFQDEMITSIKYSDNEPNSTNKENKNIVSTLESPYPIYMWFDDGTIYWWSEDKTPNMNENSSQMFRNINNLEDISGLSKFDTKSVENLSVAFAYTSISDLSFLSSWDTGNIQNMSNTFAYSYSINNLKGIDNWDVSKVTTMQGMFMNSYLLEDISALENWNVSNVENMRAIFQNANSLSDIMPLQKWNVSKVKTMNRMFFGNQTYQNKINSLNALKNWDTSSLEDMDYMFQGSYSLNSLAGLENWNVSNVTTMNGSFNQCRLLKYADLSNWDMSNVTNTTYMFDNTILEELKTPKTYPNNQNIKINLPQILYDENNNSYTKLDNTSNLIK